jgi:hypothetical protein
LSVPVPENGRLLGKIVRNQGSKHDGIGPTPSCFAFNRATGGLALTKSVENGNLSLNDLVVDIFRIRVSAIRFHVFCGDGGRV